MNFNVKHNSCISVRGMRTNTSDKEIAGEQLVYLFPVSKTFDPQGVFNK